MGVVCQILINKTKEGIFKPGASVTGIVKYNIDKPTEYKAVTLSFLGRGECRWSERRKDSSTTYTGTEEYVNTIIDLKETKADNNILEGTYEFPFEFVLPEGIPSSYKDTVCTICYRIELKFKKPKLFSFDKLFSAEIPVKGYIETTIEGPVIFGLNKTLTDLFALSKPVINIKAEIEKAYHKPGENINTSLHITNNTDLTAKVRTSLYCLIVYTANGGRTKSSLEKIRECSLDITSIPPQGAVNLSQSIPTTIDLHSINSKVMRKEYRLRVSVKLPMPHRNEYVEMPLLIGERMIDEEKIDSETSSQIDDAPPSYWEVMGEEKVGDEEYEKDAED